MSDYTNLANVLRRRTYRRNATQRLGSQKRYVEFLVSSLQSRVIQTLENTYRSMGAEIQFPEAYRVATEMVDSMGFEELAAHENLLAVKRIQSKRRNTLEKLV